MTIQEFIYENDDNIISIQMTIQSSDEYKEKNELRKIERYEIGVI